MHGRLRDALKDRVSIDFTDGQQAYMVNEEYSRREERRKLVRRKNYCKKKVGKTGSIKHDENKCLQRMQGDQLLSSGKKYYYENIQRIPQAVRNNMKVRTLHHLGILATDKELARNKALVSEKKHSIKTDVVVLKEK